MTTIVRDIFVFVTAAIFVAAAVLITTGAGAHEFKVGTLDIGHPWSRPTPKTPTLRAAISPSPTRERPSIA